MTPQEKERIFLEISESHREKIARLCAGIVGRRDEVPDLVQEIFIHIWRGLEGFRGEASLSTWVYRIALNTALLHGQRLRREERNRAEAARTLSMMGPEGDPRKEAQLRTLYEAIGELPVSERAIITLYLEGLSYEEIASVVGISANYVGVRLNRIRQALSRIVEDGS